MTTPSPAGSINPSLKYLPVGLAPGPIQGGT